MQVDRCHIVFRIADSPAAVELLHEAQKLLSRHGAITE